MMIRVFLLVGILCTPRISAFVPLVSHGAKRFTDAAGDAASVSSDVRTSSTPTELHGIPGRGKKGTGMGTGMGTDAARLLKDPAVGSIGSYFEGSTDAMKMIQCYMMNIAEVDGEQYGVGYPIDMPVMIMTFEGKEILPVDRAWDDYEHLVQHISNQLDSDEIQLYNTPICLTLQGEFEDEDMNESAFVSENVDDDDDDDGDGDDEREEATIEEIMALEGIDEDDFYDDVDDEDDEDEDDEDDDDMYEDNDTSNFLNSSPVGALDPKFSAIPDMNILRLDKPDMSEVNENAIVTDEDSKALRRAHKKADRLMSYAEDVKLIGSFHYAKKNYHLVKLLEPIVIVGQRIMDIKGYYFSLLNEEQTQRVTPEVERLLLSRPKQSPDDMEMYDDDDDVDDQMAQSGQNSRSKDGKKGKKGLSKSQQAKKHARDGTGGVKEVHMDMGAEDSASGGFGQSSKGFSGFGDAGADDKDVYRSSGTRSGASGRGKISRRRWRNRESAVPDAVRES